MSLTLPAGVAIDAPLEPGFDTVLTYDALVLVADLHRTFEVCRQERLADRAARAQCLDAGEKPDFLPETRRLRDGDWSIAPLPLDLECRRVEITGPVERKMVINAMNSGADSYMADFEDSNTPTWHNQISGQINLMDAVRRTIRLEQGGKTYQLNDKTAVLLVRPRGWHLDEKHVTVDGKRVSGGIVDFALYCFHNAIFLLTQNGKPSGGSPVERYFCPHPEGPGHSARHDQGDGAGGNHSGRLRDGRDLV
jgi:malate synthase